MGETYCIPPPENIQAKVLFAVVVTICLLAGGGVAAVGATSTGQTTQAASFEVTGLVAPTSADAGTDVSVDATVVNGGDAAGTTTVQYRIDGRVVATAEVALAAGESRTVTLGGTVPDLEPGTYVQGVFVGDTDQGATASLSVTEPAAAVFVVSDLQAPAQATGGQQVTVRATVSNDGGATGTTSLQYRIGG